MFTNVRSALRSVWDARALARNPLRAVLFFLAPSGFSAFEPCRFEFSGLQLVARRIDWLAVNEVIIEREYDAAIRHLAAHPKPIVVDLGANIGAFSLKVFEANSRALVHSVEPSYGTFAILQKNRGLNPRLDWHVHRFAAWKEDGEIELDENPAASTGSSLAFSGGGVSVPSIRLSTLVRQQGIECIDLLKLDIEGAEEAVLFDNTELLDVVDALIIEIHPYRCDEARIVGLIRDKYPFVWEILGRRSSKPLLVATRMPLEVEGARKFE